MQLSVCRDSNFPDGGRRWGHVILENWNGGAKYPWVRGVGVPESGDADFFL